MKKLTAFLAATAIVVCTGCNMYEENSITGSENKNEVISTKKESKIDIVINNNKSRGAVSITEHMVVHAAFTLKDSDGFVVGETNWDYGYGLDTLSFAVGKMGAYSLTILEIDEANAVNEESHYFDIKAGNNYVVNVTLGGNMNVKIKDSDSSYAAYAGNFAFDGFWTENSDSIGSSVMYEKVDSTMQASFYKADSLGAYASLICDPSLSLAAYDSVLIAYNSDDPILMTLSDNRYNHRKYLLPPTFGTSTEIVAFNELGLNFDDNVKFIFESVTPFDTVSMGIYELTVF